MNITLSSDSNISAYKTIVCIDGSYVIYHTLYSAVKKWIDESSYSDLLTKNDDIDDNNRIDLTAFDDFNDILKGRLIGTLTKIDYIVNDYNNISFSENTGNKLFVLDPDRYGKTKSWRYFIYPEYKGQRSELIRKKPYDVSRIFSKSIEILKDGGYFTDRFNINFIAIDNAEADDIIAITLSDKSISRFNRLLIASDHDYLQLDGITQFTIEGKNVEIEQPYPDLMCVSPSDYLLSKIITGDASDNITQVFNRVGYKTAIKKYVSDKDFLVKSLENDAAAYGRFVRNTRLIDFNMIPKKIKTIVKKTMAIELHNI